MYHLHQHKIIFKGIMTKRKCVTEIRMKTTLVHEQGQPDPEKTQNDITLDCALSLTKQCAIKLTIVVQMMMMMAYCCWLITHWRSDVVGPLSGSPRSVIVQVDIVETVLQFHHLKVDPISQKAADATESSHKLRAFL